MQRVYLTQEQREAAALERMREALTDGVLIQKLTQTMRLLRFAGLRLEGNHEPEK